ncbi:MAG: hypothetical protein ACLQI7_08410 [Streptosporangiaceae bacterium]
MALSLSDIETEFRAHAQEGEAWLQRVLAEHLPVIAATAARLEASPIAKALEGAFLPPAVEEEIAHLILVIAAREAANAPAPPEAPAEPAEGAGEPAEVQPA